MSNPQQRTLRHALNIFLAAVSGFVLVLALGVLRRCPRPACRRHRK